MTLDVYAGLFAGDLHAVADGSTDCGAHHDTSDNEGGRREPRPVTEPKPA